MNLQEITKDSEIAVIEQKAITLVDKANALIVNDELTSKSANDIGSVLKEMTAKLEMKRKFFVKPLQEHVSAINAEFKRMANPITEAYEIVRQKLRAYMIECDRMRREQEAKDRQEAEEKAQLAKDVLGEDVPMPVAEKTNTRVVSSLGKSNIVRRWRFRLIDFSKVPDEYKLLDEKKINGMIRACTKTVAGENQCTFKVAGIETYQEEDISMRK